MNEYAWLNLTDPAQMMAWLRRTGKADERQCRLFACACVRRVWASLPDDRCRQVIEVAERYADGGASARELTNAESLAAFYDSRTAPNNAARAAYYAAKSLDHLPSAASWALSEVVRLAPLDRHPSVVAAAAQAEAADVATRAAHHSANEAAARAAHSTYRKAYAAAVASETLSREAHNDASAVRAAAEADVVAAELAAQTALLRDIVSNPFRPPPAIDAAWHVWNDATLVKMARGMYDERSFARMPLLADALEDAGCTDADMLSHCRSSGDHVRGCWVLDALLGKV